MMKVKLQRRGRIAQTDLNDQGKTLLELCDTSMQNELKTLLQHMKKW